MCFVNSVRFKLLPKQFQNYNNINIIEHFISNIDISNFEIIVIVCKKIYFINNLKNLKLKNNTKIVNSQPGKNRQQSALNALKKIKKNVTNVLIHYAARPLCSNKLIKKIIISPKSKKFITELILLKFY